MTQPTLYLTSRTPEPVFCTSLESTGHLIVCVLAVKRLGLRHTGECLAEAYSYRPEMQSTSPRLAVRSPGAGGRSATSGGQVGVVVVHGVRHEFGTVVEAHVVGRRPATYELLNSWRFDSLLEARVIIENWRCDYNATGPTPPTAHSPHPSSLLQWTTTHQPQAA